MSRLPPFRTRREPVIQPDPETELDMALRNEPRLGEPPTANQLPQRTARAESLEAVPVLTDIVEPAAPETRAPAAGRPQQPRSPAAAASGGANPIPAGLERENAHLFGRSATAQASSSPTLLSQQGTPPPRNDHSAATNPQPGTDQAGEFTERIVRRARSVSTPSVHVQPGATEAVARPLAAHPPLSAHTDASSALAASDPTGLTTPTTTPVQPLLMISEPSENEVDEALVDAITDRVLAALESTLATLVSDAVREALQTTRHRN